MQLVVLLVVVAKNSIRLPLVQKLVTVINVNTAWQLDIVQVTAVKDEPIIVTAVVVLSQSVLMLENAANNIMQLLSAVMLVIMSKDLVLWPLVVVLVIAAKDMEQLPLVR